MAKAFVLEDRSFESSIGYLKVSQLPKIDWESMEQIESLLPLSRREYRKLEIAGLASKLKRQVEIPYFTLTTPYGDRELFSSTELIIEPNKRCAVYGENGSGKTSLFAALASGTVRDFPKWMSVHHMKEMPHDPESEDISVMETVVSSHPEMRVITAIREQLRALCAAEDASEALKKNLAWAEFEASRLLVDNAVENAQKMLRVLGFDEEGEQQPMSSLSGGLRMRVALASPFFINPDLLLLDEPTNHLDLPSVLWLENKLRAYKGSFLICTHDRRLLENVVTSVQLLQDQQIVPYALDFKAYEKQKKIDDEKRATQIDKFLTRNRNIDPSSPEYRIKLKYQEWQAKRTARLVLMSSKFTFQAPGPLKCDPGMDQKDVPLITVENVRFSYSVEKGLPFIFDNPISYEVTMNTRVGIMGPNGAGKSTFLKLITGKIFPVDGTVKINPDMQLAYFGQHSTKELDMEMTPYEFMVKSFPTANVGKIKLHLNKTSISDGEMQTRMKNCSFSQRSCVIFAKLTFIPPHLLIMDEPTNFLDLDSVDSLIKAANGFSGGLIVVTHNRDFLKRCSRNFLSIVPGSFDRYDTMQEAERATYSFISALERGEQVDAKQAIMDNRGGGAKHTEDTMAAQKKRLTVQQVEAQKKADAAKAEADKIAAAAAAKEAKIAAKQALVKTDWAPGDVCYVVVKGAWKKGEVLRSVPGMGVTVQMATGGRPTMFENNKLRVDNPDAGKKSAAPGPKKGGRKGGNQGGAQPQRGQANRGRGGRGTGGGVKREGGQKSNKGGNRNRGGSGGGRGGGRGGARAAGRA
jgi:ATPase subunit of ABC transporter with duplicated ATPase domains